MVASAGELSRIRAFCSLYIHSHSRLPLQCQTFLRRSCSQFIKPGEFNGLLTTFSIIDMLMDEAIEENPDDYEKYIQSYIQASILYALTWGIGGVLDTNSREKFDGFLRKVSLAAEASSLLFNFHLF